MIAKIIVRSYIDKNRRAENTMKTIGLIGGMSWESSAEYYRIINEYVKDRLGGFHSSKCLMYSVDFAEVEQLQIQGRWTEAGEMMADAAKRLEMGGADFIVLCTNTMHKLTADIEQAVGIPFLHIADATAKRIHQAGIKKIALLGTGYTMEQHFYKERLINSGLDVIIPDKQDRDNVHGIIFNELVLGIVSEKSKAEYLRIIDKLSREGAEGVILGCTEIGLLIKQEDCSVPVFDTTVIHAQAAAQMSLS